MLLLETVSDLVWGNTEHTAISLSVEHSRYGVIPFGATQDDPEPHGRDLFARAVAGEFGPIAEYVAPVVPRLVPRSVTRYQGRAALLQMGLLDDVDAHYAALPTDTADAAVNLKNRLAKERWAGMLNFEIDSPELLERATAFGLTQVQVEDLFIFANTIK